MAYLFKIKEYFCSESLLLFFDFGDLFILCKVKMRNPVPQYPIGGIFQEMAACSENKNS